MLVLTINSGSSSLKYKLFDSRDFSLQLSGQIERIGKDNSKHQIKKAQDETWAEERSIKDHAEAIRIMMDHLELDKIMGIGHRVVHGGEQFQQPCIVDDEVTQAIHELIPLAPLHNPANLAGIYACQAHFPDIPQVCVFDTAFHQSIPKHAFHYALPMDLYNKHQIRRYGFHGTSHNFVAKQAAHYFAKDLAQLNLITLHLGNGASACAIQNGKSMDTSMGLTPLEGLMMGTRSGDLDAAIVVFLANAGYSVEKIDQLLNKQSGLLGICGQNDMREIQSLATQGNEAARLAMDMFCYRIQKYIGAYFAVLSRLDGIVFTAGIGENSADIRAQCCANLEHLGIQLDQGKNQERKVGEIQAADSVVKILLIPTNEGAEIAAQTYECIQQRSG